MAVLNSVVTDFVVRQKVGGSNLNFFSIKQFSVLLPSTFDNTCKWDKTKLMLGWLTPRVMELMFTSYSLQSFARELEYMGNPFHWDVERRLLIRCELDAAFFHLYGVNRLDVDYIMDTGNVKGIV